MRLSDLITVILSVLFLLSLIFYLIYGKFTERKFNSIAEKFSKKFGYMPFSMTVGKNGGFFFWGYKESYLICALLFPRIPATKKTLTEEEIVFFKKLERNEISWFYRKCVAMIIGVLSFIGLLIILKLKAA
ncbi:hypothetical protein ACGVWS_08675 [Enterobacteriaceae bacterium LUAb1]